MGKLKKVIWISFLVIFGGSGLFLLVANAFTDPEMFKRQVTSIWVVMTSSLRGLLFAAMCLYLVFEGIRRVWLKIKSIPKHQPDR